VSAADIDTAMVLAAGRGTRLRPLTERVPKPLLEAGGQTLIGRHLAQLAAIGIRRAVVNLHHLGEQVRAYLGDGRRFGLEIVYSQESELLETGGGIRQALPWLGDAPFLVVNGDVHTDFPLERLLTQPGAAVDCHLVLVPHPPWRDAGDFDLADPARAEDAGTRRLVAGDGPRLIYAGLAALRPGPFAARAPGFFPLRPLIDAAIAAGRATGERYDGAWEDVGTPERLEALRRRLEVGPTRTHEGERGSE